MCNSDMYAENSIYNPKENIELSDFFKGIAIAMVVLTHSHQMFDIPMWLFEILDFLQLGCQIFFVLSAYGLCFSYSKNSPTWIEFMKRRVSKLFVGYWSMILFYMAYQVFHAILSGMSVSDSLNLPGILINMLFLNGFVPNDYINNNIVSGGWFVGTLFILYMLFPLLYKIYEWNNVKWRKVRLIVFPCAFFIVSVLLINIAGMYNINLSAENAFIYRSALNQLPCFALGFCLYDVFSSKKLYSVKCPALFFILFLIAAVFIFMCDFMWVYTVCHVLFAASFVFLYIFVCREKNLHSCIVNSTNKFINLIKKCGRMSYFIYLVQSIVIFYFMFSFADFIGLYINNDLLCYILFLPVIAVLCFFMSLALCRFDKFIRKLK